jgi:hypothetical protein
MKERMNQWVNEKKWGMRFLKGNILPQMRRIQWLKIEIKIWILDVELKIHKMNKNITGWNRTAIYWVWSTYSDHYTSETFVIPSSMISIDFHDHCTLNRETWTPMPRAAPSFANLCTIFIFVFISIFTFVFGFDNPHSIFESLSRHFTSRYHLTIIDVFFPSSIISFPCIPWYFRFSHVSQALQNLKRTGIWFLDSEWH